MAKDPKEVTRLHSDHLQPSKSHLGPQDGGLVPCSRKPNIHPHHPSNEACELCPERPKTYGKEYYNWANRHYPNAYSDEWEDLTPNSQRYWDSMAEAEIADCINNNGCVPMWHPSYRS